MKCSGISGWCLPVPAPISIPQISMFENRVLRRIFVVEGRNYRRLEKIE
jgi:hypothetical protein